VPPALRFPLEYDEASLRMLERSPLEKQTAPSHDWEGADGESGFWVEVRSAANTVLYRRVMDDPLYRFEAPVNDNGQLRSASMPGRSGTFTFVVPIVSGAHTLMIWASRPREAPATAILTASMLGTV
jgi:hypothetical protein